MLEVAGINKHYGARQVLTDVNFTIGDGRMTGFVGANGSGKTTTMRIILGVLAADSGQVLLDGIPLTAEVRRRFGYMPEERGLYPKMRVQEQLVYLARLHGVPPKAAADNADALLERLGLTERARDLVESLSLGNQQRAQIAAALVHDPEFLVLDEPFSGLDPIAVETVLTVLRDYAAGGVPVLFSSHQLDLVERLCDDLVIIADGSIRAAGPSQLLRDEHSTPRFELHANSDVGWLRQVSGVNVLEFDGSWAQFEAESESVSQAVLREALERGSVTSFGRDRPSLATIFTEVVQ